MLVRKSHIDKIKRLLATLRAEVELGTSVNLNDLNIHAENFYRDFLNLVYNLKLQNLNTRSQNRAYIDLIDTEKRIAIQVTSDNSVGKIVHSVEGLLKEPEYLGFQFIVLLIAKQARGYRKKFTFGGEREFDPEKDVLDIERILRDILDKETVELQAIADFLEENLVASVGKRLSLAGTVPGAEQIDLGFIQRIENGPEFSRARFYTGDQEGNCQWYGVLRGFDVSRDAYPEIESCILRSFDTFARYKVAAVVSGSGGSGKSTLLRRLALEIGKLGKFKVIWVLNTRMAEFEESAIRLIQSDPQNNYIVFIEDWYRIDSDEKALAARFIRNSQDVSNVRVVVGDRDPEGTPYWNDLSDKANGFVLEPSENRRIIHDILKQHPEWSGAATEALGNESAYHSALFLILFVLAGISERRFDKNQINFNDLRITAQAIARYDLRSIGVNFPGLAKALYYWSAVYAQFHIFITYSSFLKIADYFNGDEKPSRFLGNWKADDDALEKLRLYVSVGANENLSPSYSSLDLIQFNHDKLAEDVIAGLTFPGWKRFDDTMRKVLLDILVAEGDGYSASIVASRFLNPKAALFGTSEEIRAWIDRLFYERKNRHPQYLSALADIDLDAGEIYRYLSTLIDEGLYPVNLWSAYFKKATDAEKAKAASVILNQKDFHLRIPFSIVSTAMKFSKDSTERGTAVSTILSYPNFQKLPFEIVSTAMKFSVDADERRRAASAVLSYPDFHRLPYQIVSTAIRISNDEAEKKRAVSAILSHPDFYMTLPVSIVSTAMNTSKDEDEKKRAASAILSHNDFHTLPFQIVSTAMNVSKDIEEKNRAAATILLHPEFHKLPPQIVSTAMKLCGDRGLRDGAAAHFLANWRSENWGVVFRALHCFSDLERPPDFVFRIVETIVREQFDRSLKEKMIYPRFLNLMKIPFHNIPVWKRQSQIVIAKWSRRPRALVANVFSSYVEFPDETSSMAHGILDNWETEIQIAIPQLGGRVIHYGDHIRLAMGHPALRSEAHRTASEMLEASDRSPNILPDYMFEIAKTIIEKGQYPDWHLDCQ